MTVTVKAFISPSNVAAASTVQYTANNAIGVVDKLTLTNTTNAPVIVNIFIVASSGAAAATNCILYQKSIAAGETYNCPEMIGQVIPASSSIVTTASGTGVTISSAGRELT